LLTPVKELEKGKEFVNIYPNPATNEITIEIQKEKGTYNNQNFQLIWKANRK